MMHTTEMPEHWFRVPQSQNKQIEFAVSLSTSIPHRARYYIIEEKNRSLGAEKFQSAIGIYLTRPHRNSKYYKTTDSFYKQETNMQINRDFIKKLPKSELHVHLDGSLRLGTLIDLAKARNVTLPSFTVDGLRELVFKDKYQDLGEYLVGFGLTTAVMQDEEAT